MAAAIRAIGGFVRRWVGLALVALCVSLIAPATAHHRSFRGDAIYYADDLVGNTMACGGTYRHDKMVTAHLDLPCGTELRVKNLANGRTVRVTVKDRGPFGGDAILDVSKRAARRLAFIKAGRANVRAVILHK